MAVGSNNERLFPTLVTVADIPVMTCGATVLRNPTNQQIADCLGFDEAIDQKQIRDLIIVGAGPAGLAAAVYGASAVGEGSIAISFVHQLLNAS